MAITVSVDCRISVTYTAGDKRSITYSPADFSLTDYVDKVIPVAADQTLVVWDTSVTGVDQPTDFDCLILVANGTLDVELTTNEGNANEELHTFRLIASVPYILGADDSYFNHSASNAYGGTLNVINKIRVDEPNSTAVELRIILGT